jgi:hypothetical protein
MILMEVKICLPLLVNGGGLTADLVRYFFDSEIRSGRDIVGLVGCDQAGSTSKKYDLNGSFCCLVVIR